MPDEEREEIREIYATKGFSGQLLDDVVATITSNRETWVNTMMEEELHPQQVEGQSLLRSAIIVTLAKHPFDCRHAGPAASADNRTEPLPPETHKHTAIIKRSAGRMNELIEEPSERGKDRVRPLDSCEAPVPAG